MSKMRLRLFNLLLPLALAVFLISAPGNAFPAEDGPYGFVVGVVSADEGWRIIVSERERVLITHDTAVLDHREKPASRYDVSEGRWVYAEGERLFDGSVRAERVYVLPGPPRRGAARHTFINMPLE